MFLRRKIRKTDYDGKCRNDLNDIIKILSKIISSSKGKIPGFIEC